MLILSPAKTVIEMCGGALAVAKMTQRNAYRVRRWTWPKEKGGTDGVIPLDAMQQILAKAPGLGISGLAATHFLDGVGALARDDLRTLALLMDGHTPEAIAKQLRVQVGEVISTELRLRAEPLIGECVWDRVARRRSPGYRSRARV